MSPPSGLEAIWGRLVKERGLTVEHATQWLTHVGLERPVEQIEGDSGLVGEVRRVLEQGVAGLIDELRLSLDYYGAQEGAAPVGRVVLCGPGSTIPGLLGPMEAGLDLSVSVAQPPALAQYDAAAAARLTLPFGLAQEA